ncbi:MAG: rod shape-determining protein [Muricomes sp.]|uniref:rod shape-determining protein n=1 Tax=Faecalicatena contorta TaxID=39482 RepID=UPI002EA56512|nr:rod shape-determining protein [Muricomes sp.]
MARNVYGLDLGTYEIKVYDKKKDEIWKAKNVIAMQDKKYIFSVGDEAYKMYEKAPDNIKVVFPMHNGVIAHFDDMQYLLQNLLKMDRQFSRGAEYVIAVPTDVTEVEKRAFYDLVFHSTAKAKSVRIVERGIADALGMDIDIWNEKGIFIVNIGGETTELSVIASGGMVLNRLIKIGGIHFDNAITHLVRHNRDFLIGRLTAETLRREFGVFDQAADASLTVAGRNLITGVPQQKSIPIGLVRAAMKEPLSDCVRAIKSMIDRTPPDVRRGIDQNGICLTGGLANLKGLSTYLEESTGLGVRTVQNPELCAVSGLKKIILNKDYSKLTYSMLDEDYRWLR